MSYPTQRAEHRPATHQKNPEYAEDAAAAVPPPPSALPGAREMPAGESTIDSEDDSRGDAADSWGEPTGGPAATDLPADTGAAATTTYASAASSAATVGPDRLWRDDAAEQYRARIREIQIRFVDEPEGATGEARDLVADVLQQLWETLAARKTEIDSWEQGDREDTEQLRMAVRSYRDLLDDLLSR